MHYTGHRCSGWVLQLLTTAHTVKAIHLTITSTLYGSVHLFRGTGTGFVKTYQSVLNALFQPLPLVCLLGDLDGVTTEDNNIHMAFTALCIAKKTVLMNWKNKNNLNINQYRDYLWDYISLETASADTLDQSLWAPLISSIT